jgi:hypothetical protein
LNRKDRVRPAPIRAEDAIKHGIIRIVTDPKEIAELIYKERHEMGHRDHTDKIKTKSDNEWKYMDASYTIDPHYKGMV